MSKRNPLEDGNLSSIDNMNDEELGITLNYLISNVNTSQIPNDYKAIIRKQI